MTEPALSGVEAVTFDFWNTLVASQTGGIGRAARVTAVGDVLTEAGQHRPPELIDQAFDRAYEVWESEWKAGRLSGADAGTRVVLNFLRTELPERIVVHLIGQVEWAGSQMDLQPAPGAAEALARLKLRGIRIGIISDTGLTGGVVLRSQLDRLGLLAPFDHWSFSNEVGAFKPAVEMFEHARAGLGVNDVADIAHVGDLLRTDIAGARAAGWRSIRYTGFFDDAESLSGSPESVEADLVVPSFSALADAFGA